MVISMEPVIYGLISGVVGTILRLLALPLEVPAQQIEDLLRLEARGVDDLGAGDRSPRVVDDLDLASGLLGLGAGCFENQWG